MRKKVAINGFGRIGRLVLRHLIHSHKIDVVAINDIAPLDNLLYLLKHDSTQRVLDISIRRGKEQSFLYGDKEIAFISKKDPSDLPWKTLGVEIVIEATGLFTDRTQAAKHLKAGAKRVIISAPSDNVDRTICMGVNEETFEGNKDIVVSNASCVVNCLAPVAKVLDDHFSILAGILTTVQAYTHSQNIVDSPNIRWRRGRAGAVSLVPTKTGAENTIVKVLPQLEGKIDSMAIRAPIPAGSLIDFKVHTEKPVTVGLVNKAFIDESDTKKLKGILSTTTDELVSVDIIGCDYSALVDLKSTTVVGDHDLRVLAWYDNEWAYAKRCADLGEYIATSKNL